MVFFILTFSSTLLLVTVLLSCLTGSLSFVFHFLCLSFCQLFSLLLLFPTPSLPVLAFFSLSISLSFCFSLSLPTTPPTLSLSLSFPCILCFSLFPRHSLAFSSQSFSIYISLSFPPSSSLPQSHHPFIFLISFINPHSTSVSISFSQLQSTPSPLFALTLIIMNDVVIWPYSFPFAVSLTSVCYHFPSSVITYLSLEFLCRQIIWI